MSLIAVKMIELYFSDLRNSRLLMNYDPKNCSILENKKSPQKATVHQPHITAQY